MNSLLNNEFLDWSKFKAFTEDKVNFNLKTENLFGMDRKIVGKGEKIRKGKEKKKR